MNIRKLIRLNISNRSKIWIFVRIWTFLFLVFVTASRLRRISRTHVRLQLDPDSLSENPVHRTRLELTSIGHDVTISSLSERRALDLNRRWQREFARILESSYFSCKAKINFGARLTEKTLVCTDAPYRLTRNNCILFAFQHFDNTKFVTRLSHTFKCQVALSITGKLQLRKEYVISNTGNASHVIPTNNGSFEVYCTNHTVDVVHFEMEISSLNEIYDVITLECFQRHVKQVIMNVVLSPLDGEVVSSDIDDDVRTYSSKVLELMQFMTHIGFRWFHHHAALFGSSKRGGSSHTRRFVKISYVNTAFGGS